MNAEISRPDNTTDDRLQNNARLREIMEANHLSRADVGRLLGKKILANGACPVVNKWMASPLDKANYRRVPDGVLELLEAKLELAALKEKNRKLRQQVKTLRLAGRA